MDAPRIDAIFYAPSIGITEEGKTWMRENGPDLNVWVESLKAPAYPYAIDTALAEEGAELFHTLDMWAPQRQNPIRRPEGNGSCASCHGAYAPRYVNDPSFLDTPALEGIASYIVPLDIIGTDPERVNANNDAVQEAGTTSFFAYPPTVGTDQDCGPQNRPELRGDREPGYLAPPLYGVWATAPYFHNGSVPNVWEVLQPADRQQIWRRVSKPVPAPQQGCFGCSVVMGYDTDLDRAYDPEKMGWRYDAIPCEAESASNPSVSPYVNCNPSPEDQADPMAEQILTEFYSGVLLGWNLVAVPPLTEVQMQDRKNYNTRMFAQGNEGHEFNSVLTDHERRAIIEYLKTL
jgi:mono/diheme cytochrome c family protein